MSCRVFFELLTTRDDVSARASLIDDAHPNAECEAESVSAHSGGVVTDDEFAHRYVFSPLHLHDGKVVTALFSDAKNKGLSCERSVSRTPPDELHARAISQVQSFNANRKPTQDERNYAGAVTAQVGNVRYLEVANQRAYSVYDTALLENTAHIDVIELPSAFKSLSKSEQKLARLMLAEIFTDEPITS